MSEKTFSVITDNISKGKQEVDATIYNLGMWLINSQPQVFAGLAQLGYHNSEEKLGKLIQEFKKTNTLHKVYQYEERYGFLFEARKEKTKTY